MRIPKKFKIYGFDIDIKMEDGAFPVQMSDGTTTYANGSYNTLTDKIRISNTPNKPSIMYTNTIHEIIEAINFRGDLKLNHTQITSLASALYQAMQTAEYD